MTKNQRLNKKPKSVEKFITGHTEKQKQRDSETGFGNLITKEKGNN